MAGLDRIAKVVDQQRPNRVFSAMESSPRLRLLMPRVRHAQATPLIPRSPRLRPTTSKLIRSRSGSTSHTSEDPITVSSDVGSDWLGFPSRFEIVQEQLQIDGYQMYAVEKWYACRIRSRYRVYPFTGLSNGPGLSPSSPSIQATLHTK